MDCSLPASSVHGISQARILEWVSISFSRGSFWPRNWTCISCVSCIGRRILCHWAIWLFLFEQLDFNFTAKTVEPQTPCFQENMDHRQPAHAGDTESQGHIRCHPTPCPLKGVSDSSLALLCWHFLACLLTSHSENLTQGMKEIMQPSFAQACSTCES